MRYPIKPGFTLIFRPWITLPNGKILHAKQIGKKAFPIWVKN